ncbi:hypothetical protein Dimus_034156 [Dionaea muscipula]
MEEEKKHEKDDLADALADLFTSVSTVVKSELQGTNNLLELLEKMNLRVADEYNGFSDVASGLRVFVEQLKCKSSSFDEYVQQIDAIEQQVTELEAVITMLNKYVSMLETKVHAAYHAVPSHAASTVIKGRGLLTNRTAEPHLSIKVEISQDVEHYAMLPIQALRPEGTRLAGSMYSQQQNITNDARPFR